MNIANGAPYLKGNCAVDHLFPVQSIPKGPLKLKKVFGALYSPLSRNRVPFFVPRNSRALGCRVSTTMPLLFPIQWWHGRPSAVPEEWDAHTPVYLAVLRPSKGGKPLPLPHLWCVPHYHPDEHPPNPAFRKWWCSRDGVSWGRCPQPEPWHFWLQYLSFEKNQGM